MDKAELNKEIAKYFGWNEFPDRYNYFNGRSQWKGPVEGPTKQYSQPNFVIPDFLQILDNSLRFLTENVDGVLPTGEPDCWKNEYY
jgi:hypothetical protein